MFLLGKPVADKIYEDLRTRIGTLQSKGVCSTLVAILVGDRTDSKNLRKHETKEMRGIKNQESYCGDTCFYNHRIIDRHHSCIQ